MSRYAGSSAPRTAVRTGDVVGTLRLLAYLALSLILIVLDHRGGWLHQSRAQAALVAGPLLVVAGWPGRLAERLREDAGTLNQLGAENRRLRSELLVDRARMARMTTVVADNARLRTLLDAAQRARLDVQLAPVLDVDLDPTRQRLLLDAGSRDNVRVGQTVIDAGGLLGQVTQVTPMHATVLLLTDPDHAVPVAIARNGVRLVAYGRGRSDLLALASVPLSSDVKIGDLVVTSGLGGRFPPGFPVGTVTAMRPDESRAFLLGDVKPAAQLDRGRDVLLLRSEPARTLVGDETVQGKDQSSAAVQHAGLGAAQGRDPGLGTGDSANAQAKPNAQAPSAAVRQPVRPSRGRPATAVPRAPRALPQPTADRPGSKTPEPIR